MTTAPRTEPGRPCPVPRTIDPAGAGATMKSHKQRQAELAAKRAARAGRIAREAQLRQLAAEEEARRREGRPDLPVDFDALRPNGSYYVPDFVVRGSYRDLPFTCRTCGAEEVWTAEQQKWWYEEAQGRTTSGPGGCRACRQRARAARLAEQAPRGLDPSRSPRRLIAAVAAALEPALRAAGFCRIKAHGGSARLRAEFERPGGDLVAITLRAGRLAAEALTGGGADLRSLATVAFPCRPARTPAEVRDQSPADVRDQLAEFVASVRAGLASPGPST